MQDNDKKTDVSSVCRRDEYDTELSRLEKSESIKFRYRSLTILTVAIAMIAVGSVATLMYGYANNDRDFEEGAFGAAINGIIEVIKIVIGMA